MKKSIKSLAMMMLAGFWSGVALAGGHLMVDNAWIREAPPGATALAGYMTVHNDSDKERVLVGASSPAFGNVMLHRTVMENGMAKMVHQMAITIPAGGKVTFKPNDYHIMLMKPKHALKAGDKVDITLEFKNGETMTVTHEVRAGQGAGMDMNMKGMDHGSMNHGM